MVLIYSVILSLTGIEFLGHCILSFLCVYYRFSMKVDISPASFSGAIAFPCICVCVDDGHCTGQLSPTAMGNTVHLCDALISLRTPCQKP